MAASSNFGRASRREAVDRARDGRVVVSVARWVAESMMDLCERLERAWSARCSDCVDWERDRPSPSSFELRLRDARGRVVSRLRYAAVVGSVGEGRGVRDEREGVSK